MSCTCPVTAICGASRPAKVAPRCTQVRAAGDVETNPSPAASPNPMRRNFLQQGVASAVALLGLSWAPESHAFTSDLCDADCDAGLGSRELVTTSSGLQYKDLVVGKGPTPPVGFQVVAHYIAMTPEGRVFESSFERGAPYDIRVGAGIVIAGLDEGLLTMRPGGIRRLFIPGDLAFPNGLKAAAGRARVPPASPVVFDVQLLYIPGMDIEE